MTAELRALNARFINNFITNDVPGHDAILHEGFICIAPTGVRVDMSMPAICSGEAVTIKNPTDIPSSAITSPVRTSIPTQ